MHLWTTFEWKRFFKELYDKAFDTDVFNHSAQVAFYFSFALFPLLFALVSLFGMVLESTQELRSEIYIYLRQILPYSAYELVHKTLDEIMENSSGGKLTIGLLVALWSASAGVDSLRSSLNFVYELREGRAWWRTKLQSLVMTVLFIVLLAVSLAGVTAGWQLIQLLLRWSGIEVDSPLLLVFTQWMAIGAVLLFATAVIYSWLPCFKQFKWIWISPGAIIAVLLWVALSSGFRIYLQYFNTYDRTYGSLGAVIILMLWMYLTAMALLIGGAINSVLSEMTGASVQEPLKTQEDSNTKDT
jgi:membrane protein